MTSQREAFEKFRDGYVSDQDRKPTAFETWQAAIEDYKASLVPVAVYKNESITATYGVKWLVQTPLKNDTKLYTLEETK